MAQTIQIKRNNSNAATKPTSLLIGELAGNLLDRSLYSYDGSSIFQFYTGTTKWFDTSGNANNALKLGGVAASDYATQTWVTNAYQTKLSLTNKLNASYISGLATVATSGKYSDLTGVPTSLPASDVYSWAKAATKPSYAFSEITSKPTTLIGYGITDFVRSNVTDSINNYTTQAGIYRLSSHANSATPDNAGYGTALTLYAGADTWSQIYASYGLSQNDAGLYWRGATTSNNDIAWRRVLDSANYSSYALPLSGGIIGNGVSGVALTIDRASTNPTTIKFNSNGSLLGYIGFDTSKNPIVNIDSAVYTIYHTGNFNPANYLPKSGGAINGNLFIGNVDNIDYKYLQLIRLGHGVRLNNTNVASVLAFGAVDNTGYMTAEKYIEMGDNGLIYSPDNTNRHTLIHSGNIGSYNAGSATKLQTARTIWGQSFDGSANIPYTAIPNMTYILFNKDASTPIGYVGKGGASDHLYFGGYDGVPITLFTNRNPSNNLTITTTGNVLIGTTTDKGAKLQVNGNITASSTIAMATLSSSDRRLKNNITSLSAKDSLSIIRQLRPTSWNWKKDGSKSYGFIAQEVQPLVKEMVYNHEDNLYLQYNQLHAFEVGAIQQVDNDVEQLKKELKKANKKIESLENKIKQYRRL